MSGADGIVEKRKWDGSISARWQARLWQEEDRVQLWTPAGTRRTHPRRGEVEVLDAHERAATRGRGWLVTAVLSRGGELLRYEVDATRGGERVSDGRFTFVDLDVDLVIADGAQRVEDLAEFARHREEFGYPDEVMRAALRSLEEARALYAAGSWPFDGSLTTSPD